MRPPKLPLVTSLGYGNKQDLYTEKRYTQQSIMMKRGAAILRSLGDGGHFDVDTKYGWILCVPSQVSLRYIPMRCA